ncbi:hypothetical protein LTR62_007167 [Meristemomyces frigidus]|uniref:DSC E3 ubiquitin ligase complex subunit A n=1 Tax=Meristemomyces frigidus TaxID=1508187 RepID=A0AAN7YMH6_9PEZI|nr:hypothetical protein LTR62_007167 [Meristemomyces frigidus]
MADRRGILLTLVIFGFIFLSPPGPNGPPAARLHERPRLEDVIAEEERSLEVLRNATYSDLWENSANGRLLLDEAPQLNLTGFRPDQGFAWAAIPAVKKRARELLNNALGTSVTSAEGASGIPIDLPPLYTNITGYVHGPWVRSKLQDTAARPHLNLSSYAGEGPFGALLPRVFDRNITGDAGDVSIRFHERSPYAPDILQVPGSINITGLGAEITLRDPANENEAELQLYGVYNMDLGQAILTTTSEKMAGVFMLAHFALSEGTYAPVKAYMNHSISQTVQKRMDGIIESFNPWPSTGEGGPPSNLNPPNCELIIWLQQLPPRGLPIALPQTNYLRFLESELRFPTGAFLPPAPQLRFNMLAFSPDCGYVLESKGEPDFVPQEGEHLVGPKIETLFGDGRNHLLLFALIIGGQIALLKRQMHEASTPSTRSRISFTTIAMLALGDGFATMTLLLASLFISNLSVDLMAVAFLSFVAVSFFGMRFMFDVWTAHAPERERAAREEAEEERHRRERLRDALERIRAERNERLQQLAAARTSETSNVEQPVVVGPPLANHEQTTVAADPPAGDALPAPAAATPPMDSTLPLTTANVPPPSDPQLTTPALAPTTTNTPSATVPVTTAAGADQTIPDTLPLPVTAQRPTDTGATPIFMPSDQDGLITQTEAGFQINMEVEPRISSFGSLYMRFYFMLLGVLFVSLNAAGWPSVLRRFYFTTIALVYCSFWIPQIFRNVQRNCRKALRTEFVLGQSVLRMMPFVYFFWYKHNVLFASQSLYSLTLLALWLWIQIVIITSQEIIGPRWFIRKDWAPPAYDYHPVLREDEEGNTLPLGLSEATPSSPPTSPLLERRVSLNLSSPIARRSSLAKEHKERGKRVYDCAICFQDLEVPVVETDESGDSGLASGLLARRNYMVTPCRHIFHTACLEGWMKYRLQCPICREALPAL